MTVHAVHHINCATMCPIASGFLLGGDFIAHCLLVETERDGLVLIDTGFGMRDIEGKTNLSRAFKKLVRPVLDRNETAFEQVRALGFAAEDVRHIVVTHLDVDHAGGISDFPHAKVHVHAREHTAAMTRPTFKERERYVRAHWSHGPKWEVYTEDGDTWRGLPAVTRLRGLDADVGIVPMHGHTRGHSAVVVRGANDRWLVHAGDAYFHRRALEGGTQPIGVTIFERSIQMASSARSASLAALRQLRASYDDLDLFCAHDAREYSALRGA